jgi:hypothetical protein
MNDKAFHERKGWGKDYWFATRKFKMQNAKCRILGLRRNYN